jgi:hypothetical protein
MHTPMPARFSSDNRSLTFDVPTYLAAERVTGEWQEQQPAVQTANTAGAVSKNTQSSPRPTHLAVHCHSVTRFQSAHVQP